MDVFYFATLIPMHVLFCEDGAMEKKVYLNTWKDIPDSSEVQSTVSNNMSAGKIIVSRIRQNSYRVHTSLWPSPYKFPLTGLARFACMST